MSVQMWHTFKQFLCWWLGHRMCDNWQPFTGTAGRYNGIQWNNPVCKRCGCKSFTP